MFVLSEVEAHRTPYGEALVQAGWENDGIGDVINTKDRGFATCTGKIVNSEHITQYKGLDRKGKELKCFFLPYA